MQKRLWNINARLWYYDVILLTLLHYIVLMRGVVYLWATNTHTQKLRNDTLCTEAKFRQTTQWNFIWTRFILSLAKPPTIKLMFLFIFFHCNNRRVDSYLIDTAYIPITVSDTTKQMNISYSRTLLFLKVDERETENPAYLQDPLMMLSFGL